jgi:hypothetical protein
MSKKYKYEPLTSDDAIDDKSHMWLEHDGKVIGVYVMASTSCGEFAIVNDTINGYGKFVAEFENFRKRVKVEEPEERKPAEGFAVVRDRDNKIISIVKSDYEPEDRFRTVLVREVIEPEAKERPDSPGFWLEIDSLFMQPVKEVNGELKIFCVHDGSWHSVKEFSGKWRKFQNPWGE